MLQHCQRHAACNGNLVSKTLFKVDDVIALQDRNQSSLWYFFKQIKVLFLGTFKKSHIFRSIFMGCQNTALHIGPINFFKLLL